MDFCKASAVAVQAIADHFGISGEVTSVRVVNKGQGQTKAWVEYQTPQQAVTAREHDQTVSHSTPSQSTIPPRSRSYCMFL